MTPVVLILIGGIALEVMIVTGLLLITRHTRRTITNNDTHQQPKDAPQ